MRGPVVLLSLLVLFAAGCGNNIEQRNAYVAAVNEARQAFDGEVATITARLKETSTPAKTRKALGELRDAADGFVGALQAVQPPEAVVGLHDDFVAAATGYRTELNKARERFRNDDPSVYLQARTDLQRDVAAAGAHLNTIIDRINERLRT